MFILFIFTRAKKFFVMLEYDPSLATINLTVQNLPPGHMSKLGVLE